jgi:hypothetical protein
MLMKTVLLFSILLSTQVCATAQYLSIGVKLGGFLTDTFGGSPIILDESKFYTVGPSFGIDFRKGPGLEVDALYHHVGYDLQFGQTYYRRERSTSWEFPILAKYHFLQKPHFQPFAGGGYALRQISGSVSYSLTPPLANPPQSGRLNTNYSVIHGFVAAGGLDLEAGHLRFIPEVRYTRWVQTYGLASADSADRIGSTQNQIQLLIGISFP